MGKSQAHSPWDFFQKIHFIFNYLYAWGTVQASVVARGARKAAGLLEGELHTVVSTLVWVLGTKLSPPQKQYAFLTPDPSPRRLLGTFEKRMGAVVLSP